MTSLVAGNISAQTAEENYDKGVEVYQSGNHELAFKYFEKAANQGLADSQYLLGLYYIEGKGVEQNEQKAAYWWEKAANQGHAKAQFNFAVCYENGKGVKKSRDQALYWYTQAKENGNKEAKKIIDEERRFNDDDWLDDY